MMEVLILVEAGGCGGRVMGSGDEWVASFPTAMHTARYCKEDYC
jgi:hypothetical protein